ncbi:MAG: HDIG domain-containing metalloprotein, partial [Planctomycetota bacterium]
RQPGLKPTLVLNVEQTRQSQESAAAKVPEKTKEFFAGENVLASAGEPLGAEQIDLLRREHRESIALRTIGDRAWRFGAMMGMFAGVFTLTGFYLHRRSPSVIGDLWQLSTLLGLVVLSVFASLLINQYSSGADVIPLLLFSMIIAIAYQQEMAILMSACLSLVLAVVAGYDLHQALVLAATAAGAVLVLREVRTRSKLLTVGFAAAGVGFLTKLGSGVLFGQSLPLLLHDGGVLAFWSVIAGSLMTVLLPTVEKTFGIQTDLSLIELGDPAHPLLQELIRRAPGTYNHSITVASLSEAAAESIGARGLLVRVGAYFHDIGKMLKPGYFIENQGQGDNRHDSLVPAMSTLVIIAHVKDGADLARQNRLPESIIDFIQQHHGTTLVEYFYRQASEKRIRENPDGGDVDESSFRYPGPKPQSREAGVLMLADAVESASRVLKEPTPSRIENLVEEIAMKRLLDGQFDESGLTLEEVQKIGESLVKSLTAVYHGRVKYPSQETA